MHEPWIGYFVFTGKTKAADTLLIPSCSCTAWLLQGMLLLLTTANLRGIYRAGCLKPGKWVCFTESTTQGEHALLLWRQTLHKKKKKRQKEVKNATSCDIYYFEFLSPIVYWVTNMGTWAGNSHLFPSESFMNCVRLKLISQCCLGESDVDSGNAAKYRLKWADQ